MIEEFPPTDTSSAMLHLSFEDWNKLLIQRPNVWYRLKQCYRALKRDPATTPREFKSRTKSGAGCRAMFRFLWKHRAKIREAGLDFPQFLTR
jgi:hypothetical protein